MTAFGQIVIGPPGSGKTTYCAGMKEFLSKLGRTVAVINLDPANDHLPYGPADVDISELITLEDTMVHLKLGPNGGLVYCLEYLEKNSEWLESRLQQLIEKGCYLLFDFPGQVELFTHYTCVQKLIERLTKKDIRLCAVHLVDSHYCSDPGKFIAVAMTSLLTMLRMELPHVNVLSKVDLAEQFGRLSFNLDFYTEVMDLTYLLDNLGDNPFFKKYKKLNEAICGVVQDYSLVSFQTLNIQDKESMSRLTKVIDQANGFCFGELDDPNSRSLASFLSSGANFDSYQVSEIQERFMDDDNNN